MDRDLFRNYLIATNELLLRFAREAKVKADETRGSQAGDFDAGYLMGFYRVVTLLQQQAVAFGIEQVDVGLDEIDPNRELT